MSAEPKETLEKILTLLGFTVTVEEHRMEDGILLDVKTEDSGRLIGRQGQLYRISNTSRIGCCFNKTLRSESHGGCQWVSGPGAGGPGQESPGKRRKKCAAGATS